MIVLKDLPWSHLCITLWILAVHPCDQKAQADCLLSFSPGSSSAEWDWQAHSPREAHCISAADKQYRKEKGNKNQAYLCGCMANTVLCQYL